MWCKLFHRANWVVTYQNMFGGTYTCMLCMKEHHYGGMF